MTAVCTHGHGVDGERALLSIVFQSASPKAKVFRLLAREAEDDAFRGLLRSATGSCSPCALPRSIALDDLYARLEVLLPAFVVRLVFDGTSTLTEVRLLCTSDTEARLEALEVGNGAVDEALIGLLTEFSLFVVVHAAPVGSRLTLPPVEWLRSIEQEPVDLATPLEIPLGHRLGIDLTSWCLTLQSGGLHAARRPCGFVLSGPATATRELVCAWLLEDDVAGRLESGPTTLLRSPASLVVVPHARFHLWQQLLPQALFVDDASYRTLDLRALLGPAPIVLAKEVLDQSVAKSSPRAIASLRSSAMALVRRIRCSDACLDAVPACFHAVWFRRLIVEDVSCELGAASSSIAAQIRLGLSEDGAFFSDHSYASFTGFHPERVKLDRTACVHRLLEHRPRPQAVLHAFMTNPIIVDHLPALELLSLLLRTDPFVAQLTADAKAHFTAYGREHAERGGCSECPICLTRPSTAYTPCGHSLCVKCAERLPVDTASVVASRTPLAIKLQLVRRCPICREHCRHVYARRARTTPRQRMVAKLVRSASTREVWICSHWKKALKQVAWLARDDARDVSLRLIEQSSIFPASGDAVTVIWMHPPCFFVESLDNLNMHRALGAAGGDHHKLHVVCAATDPELAVLKERFTKVGRRMITPREW